MWPSCGAYRSAMFIPAMILMRLVIAGCNRLGGLGCSTSTPSIRYLTFSSRSNGSTCTSLAPRRMASRISRFTRLISEGCSAIRCRSSASMDSRLASSSSSPPPSPRRAAIAAAVVPYSRWTNARKAGSAMATGVTGRPTRSEASSVPAWSVGSSIASTIRPSRTPTGAA
ncbi:MAG: hypothetical protein KatS3mg103_0903 [Phycisphaerales bacterium]|nr:MAG: hypothetical protein KatS3mg103_0903 [Phycisphaerales bacterium]